MAPPWTNAWDETKPADTDLANTLGTQGRQVKLDIRQRLDWQHVFNQNVNDDGGHRFVLIASAYHPVNTESFKASGFSLTGASAQSFIDLAGTWNTSGTPTGIKLNVLDTASNAAALLLDLQVGGVSKFKVDKAGNVTLSGTVGTGVAPVQTLTKTSYTLAASYNTLTNLNATISPTTSAKRVRITCSVNCGIKGKGAVTLRVTRGLGGTVVATFVGVISIPNSSEGTVGLTGINVPIDCIDSPATTSATTYYVQAQYEGTPTAAYVNNQAFTGGTLSDNPTSWITLEEIV